MPIPIHSRPTTSVELAGWLLATRRLAVENGLPWPSVDEILEATNASASREHAHEIADAVVAMLTTLEQSLSKPCSEPAAAAAARNLRLEELVRAAFRFVMRHPGCAHNGEHAYYTERYRRFVVELRKRYTDVTASEFAAAIRLPLGTLDCWMRGVHHTADARATRTSEPRVAAYNATQA